MSSTPNRFVSLLEEAAQTNDPGKTRRITIGGEAFPDLLAFLKEQFPGKVDLLLCDVNTAPVARMIGERLDTASRPFRLIVLEPSHGHDELVCDDKTIASMATFFRASESFNPIAVGAGTINDIAKMASFQTHRSYTAVPTAASMNGYTSTIAAVLADGVKRTLPCHQPVGIFADTDVVRRSPSRLNRAGFGDLLSKPFSNVDWLLSHLIRGVPYSSKAAEFLDEPFNQLIERAEGIAQSEPAAINLLLETLLLSGYSMALAGTSAPASGGEHLISHYWDMERHCQHQELRALHGTQVGIATWISSLLFERLASLDIDRVVTNLEVRQDVPSVDDIRRQHTGLSAEVCEEVHAQFKAKQKVGDDLRAELQLIRERWPTIQEAIKSSCPKAASIETTLRSAGCVTRASEIGVDEETLIHTIRSCRQIRNRYVALDLMADLGVLEGWSVDVAKTIEGLRA
jgi:glycerol-1-phosphate dehydrogenase [NAD(P)+]